MSRRRIAAATFGAMVVLLAAGLTCRREHEASTTAPTRERPGSAVATESRTQDAASTREDAERDRGAPSTDDRSTFARVTEGRTEHDLRLLADVQQHTRGPAPASVERLLALRDDGAPREDLERHIDEEIDGVMVQAACRRWLAREYDDVPHPSKIGEGGRKPSVKPVQRREQ
jgi:hypothetical protein